MRLGAVGFSASDRTETQRHFGNCDSSCCTLLTRLCLPLLCGSTPEMPRWPAGGLDGSLFSCIAGKF